MNLGLKRLIREIIEEKSDQSLWRTEIRISGSDEEVRGMCEFSSFCLLDGKAAEKGNPIPINVHSNYKTKLIKSGSTSLLCSSNVP